MMNIAVVLPASGIGSRFAADGRSATSKIEYELRHKPAFIRAIELFNARADVTQIILAVHPDRYDEFSIRWQDRLGLLGATLIAGSATERWETVKLALDEVAADASHVAVHDAARPCASVEMIDRIFAAAERFNAVVPGLPVSDTLKQATPDTAEAIVSTDPLAGIFDDVTDPVGQVHRIEQTVPRVDLFRVQTPQVFAVELLKRAYETISDSNADGITDDASAVERLGEPVRIVEGDPMNLKLTHSADAELLEAVLKLREETDARSSAVQQLFGDDDEE